MIQHFDSLSSLFLSWNYYDYIHFHLLLLKAFLLLNFLFPKCFLIALGRMSYCSLAISLCFALGSPGTQMDSNCKSITPAGQF